MSTPYSTYKPNPKHTAPAVFLNMAPEPEAMTPERVAHTARQFGQRVSKREARAISALLTGWRGNTGKGA